MYDLQTQAFKHSVINCRCFRIQ